MTYWTSFGTLVYKLTKSSYVKMLVFRDYTQVNFRNFSWPVTENPALGPCFTFHFKIAVNLRPFYRLQGWFLSRIEAFIFSPSRLSEIAVPMPIWLFAPCELYCNRVVCSWLVANCRRQQLPAKDIASSVWTETVFSLLPIGQVQVYGSDYCHTHAMWTGSTMESVAGNCNYSMISCTGWINY